MKDGEANQEVRKPGDAGKEGPAALVPLGPTARGRAVSMPSLLLQHANSGPSVAADKESSFRRDAKTSTPGGVRYPEARITQARRIRYFSSTSIGRVKRFAHAA